ncbi:Ppx/GppA family phosphatase [bacterium]|nr:Ppx/GppA family phosphatase [bacterium]
MPNFAAVDVGTNAIRMQISRLEDGSRPASVLFRREPIRLGRGVFESGGLDSREFDSAIRVLTEFAETIREHDVAAVRAVATSAVREAENGDFFCYRAQKLSGLALSPISGSEELRLVQVAVERTWPDCPSPLLLLDLGGGTLEMAVVSRGQIHGCTSLPLGGVRMARQFGADRALSDGTLEVLHRFVAVELEHAWERIGDARVEAVAAVGGIMTILRDMQAVGERPGEAPIAVTAGQLEELVAGMAGLDAAGRAEKFGLGLDRADIALPAGVVVSEVLRHVGKDKLYAPEVSLREGILFELADEYFGVREVADTEESIVDAARRLGERYRYDHEHGERVAELAAVLFDQLRPVHRMPDRMRGVLRAAAVLHDMGSHVDRASHHRHGAWLVRNSEMPGVSDADKTLIALIIRYHRKRSPSDGDPIMKNLSIELRDRVRRMTAIHRIADCLDREHRGRVENVHCRLEREGVVICGESDAPCEEEKAAFPDRSAMFVEVFKRPIRLELRVK